MEIPCRQIYTERLREAINTILCQTKESWGEERRHMQMEII